MSNHDVRLLNVMNVTVSMHLPSHLWRRRSRLGQIDGSLGTREDGTDLFRGGAEGRPLFVLLLGVPQT